jgi:predicted DNA binding CopG/RHH family protein
MQQTSAAPSTPTSASFAGLLAALTAPTPRTAWNNDDLADDVATLSYEHALRTHARYESAAPGDWAFAQPTGSGTNKRESAPGDDSDDATRTETLWPAPGWQENAESESARTFSTTLEQSKKCASITIRLSKAECDQLRQRAAQAGLTVSAYLRSCTFEAETLRAQVRDVLAELRTVTSPAKQRAPVVTRRTWFEWFLRLMPRRHARQHAAQA